jgi:hypothetical protein
MNTTVLKIAIILAAILAAAGAKYILHMPDDNSVEKIAVEVIDKELTSQEEPEEDLR